eukprot:2126698-Rhodomonas_salina.6
MALLHIEHAIRVALTLYAGVASRSSSTARARSARSEPRPVLSDADSRPTWLGPSARFKHKPETPPCLPTRSDTFGRGPLDTGKSSQPEQCPHCERLIWTWSCVDTETTTRSVSGSEQCDLGPMPVRSCSGSSVRFPSWTFSSFRLRVDPAQYQPEGVEAHRHSVQVQGNG